MRGAADYRIRWAAGLLSMAVLGAVIGAWWHRGSTEASIRHVVLISIDTCRSDHLGCYGALPAATPQLDKLSKQATLFENVITPVLLTLPAHSSMLTGTNPTYHDVHDNLNNRLSPANLTLAEVLHGNGFATGAIVSSSVLDSRFGLDQGFDEYCDKMAVGPGGEESAERPGNATSDLAIEWLERHRDQPFFLFVHYYDPHEPYAPPEPFASQFANRPYANEIAFVDQCIGRVVDKLKQLALWDSTLLIIAGDHGEMLGEHRERFHGYFIYQGALRVPLIFRLPGQKSPRRVAELVGLIDVVPTVCGLLKVDRPPILHGVDLSLAVRGKDFQLPPRALYCESFQATRYDANSLLGLVTDQWKYIQSTQPELYDLPADPQEKKNLAKESPPLLDSLHRRLQQMIQQQNRRLADSQVQLDEATRRRLESLGYVGARQNDRALAADYRQDPGKEDPKQLIDFYDKHVELVTLMGNREYSKARQLGLQMVAERPQSWIAYSYLADIALAQEDQATAETSLRAVLARKGPEHAEAHNRLGLLRMSQGRPDEAIDEFQQAVKLRPEFQGAIFNLGTALEAKGQLSAAIETYRQAVYVDPEFADAHLRLAALLQTQQQFDEALAHYRQVLKIEPTSRGARINLGMTLLKLGRTADALQELRECVQRSPDWPVALSSLAWVLSTSAGERFRNPPEAVTLAEQAAKLTEQRDPMILDVLAAAYASAGRFENAIAAERKALDLAMAAAANRPADSCRERLQLYQQGKPYREK